MELPPPRSGDWSSVNRHLTAGGSLEHVPWGNPYYEYIQSLIKKASQNREAQGNNVPTPAIGEKVEAQELVHLTSDAYIRHQTH